MGSSSMKEKKRIKKTESYGGRGWTRTTDLTLIRGAL